MAGRLEGKRAIVTGGGQGIGKAVALLFASHGAVVAVADVSQEHAVQVAEEAGRLGGSAVPVQVDVRRQADVVNMVRTFVAQAGGLDILVNSAGVVQLGPLLDVDEEEWDRTLDVNCKGTLWCSQAAARVMINQGHGGKIINLASQSGRRGEPMGVAYCASKAAVISMTQSMALSLAPYRINVNALAPGIISTPMWDEIDRLAVTRLGQPMGEARARAVAGIPLSRIGQPEDVARAALFLASSDADYVTQQCLNVDGGNWPS